MKNLRWAILLVSLAFAFPASATNITASVSLSAQRMTVSVDGAPKYHWLVSTARSGYRTPVGSFRPHRLKMIHFSRKYDSAPMPYSIFFYGGYAVHGSYAVKSLGRPVSHGCIRLAPANAATLYSLVSANRDSSRIIVTP